jgi:hypothetical protein
LYPRILDGVEGGLYCRQIEKVIKLAGENKGVPIGALTGDNRDLWVDVGITEFFVLLAFL